MGRLAITLIFELATIVMTLLPLRAQAPSARKASFEVASIKVNRTDAIGLMIDTRGDLFVATNATLRMLIRYAYSSHQVLQSYQIIGGPDWLDGPDRFDIQAKIRRERAIAASRAGALYAPGTSRRSVLDEVASEIREMPVYNLLVAKNGMKMKFSSDQTVPNLNGQAPLIFDNSIALPRGTKKLIPTPSLTGLTMTLTGSAVPVSKLTSMLNGEVGRRV